MGQKIHPVGLRVGVIRGHDSHWFYKKKGYAEAVKLDHDIRAYIKKRVGLGNVSRVEIERAANRLKVNIFTARPGAIIGRGGKGIDELTDTLNQRVRKTDSTLVVQINVSEVRQPELDAQIVAENVCAQLEKRISHRRAMRQAMTRVVRLNGRGIKLQVSGRLNGSEIARTEKDKTGKIPLHTLRADIDYGFAEAHTIYGIVGCKVWIYKGEVLPEKRLRELDEMRTQQNEDRRGRRDGGDRGPRRDRGPREGGPREGGRDGGRAFGSNRTEEAPAAAPADGEKA
jgi:small subunit ribosomal protein S3